MRESLPLSALIPAGDRVQARFFNPHREEVQLSRPRDVVNLSAAPQRSTDTVMPREILTFNIDTPSRTENRNSLAEAALLNPPQWRCGANEGQVDRHVVEEMKKKRAALEVELAGIRQLSAENRNKYKQMHAALIVEREILELEISILLNEQKASRSGMALSEATFHEDPAVRDIGIRLNELRKTRRIFDYVVGVSISASED